MRVKCRFGHGGAVRFTNRSPTGGSVSLGLGSCGKEEFFHAVGGSLHSPRVFPCAGGTAGYPLSVCKERRRPSLARETNSSRFLWVTLSERMLGCCHQRGRRHSKI